MAVSPLLLFPPIVWWRTMLPYAEVTLDVQDRFRKMSFSNRYCIATANGPLLLTVPVVGGRSAKLPMTDIRIDYKQDWQKQHWGSLFSAYGRAPFFEHYGPALEQIIRKKNILLAELNLAALQWIVQELNLSTKFLPLRPEKNFYASKVEFAEGEKIMRYYQVFEDRHGFLPNLSILDLLMNEGPVAKEFLNAPDQL